MKITLNNIGKRFNSEWIFRNVHFTFESHHAYVVLGANGSGKSTLLQIIAGNSLFSEGDMEYATHHSQHITPDTIYQHLSMAAPYLDLFEEYTLQESITFHAKYKKFFLNLSTEDIVGLADLEKSKDKQLKYFSSGMKQRVKLALAIFSDVPLLLLDEPCSNLDKEGVAWYQKMMSNYAQDRLIIVCSNQQQQEYGFCDQELLMESYK